MFVIAGIVRVIADAWGPFDAVSTRCVELVDGVLARLPTVLREDDESAAVSLATSLREGVLLALAQGD